MTYATLPAAARQGLLPALLVSVAGITGCSGADETPGADTGRPAAAAVRPTLATCSPPWTGRIETVSRSDVLAWAAQLQYGTRDTTRARLFGFGAGASAEMHLVAGLDSLGICLPTGTGCIIARIITNRAQSTLGIAVGRNYVWADSGGGAGRVIIIPEDRTAPVVVHGLRHHPFRLGGPLPAARMGPGGCGWCGDSCWCDWPTDTARFSIMRLPGEESLVRPGDTGLVRRGGRRL